jgi:hypothetical protein
MSEYDPIPDAIRFLARKAPIERHAIARLLDTDGKALPVLRGSSSSRIATAPPPP